MWYEHFISYVNCYLENERNHRRMAIHNMLHKCVAACLSEQWNEMGKKLWALRKREREKRKSGRSATVLPTINQFFSVYRCNSIHFFFLQSIQKFHRKDNECPMIIHKYIHRTGVIAYRYIIPAPLKGKSIKFPKRNQQCHKSIRMNFILPLINANVSFQIDTIGLFVHARTPPSSFIRAPNSWAETPLYRRSKKKENGIEPFNKLFAVFVLYACTLLTDFIV